MSRTRIIKGKLTEIVAKEYSIFSESNIVYNATETINAKGEEKGVSYGSPKSPPDPVTKAKCTIYFRPDNKYKDKPSFGFDWIKISDTEYPGDVWYLNHIGKYRDASDLSKLRQIYHKQNPGVFRKDLNEYNKICSTFEKLVLEAKKAAGSSNYIYYVPKMTLRKNTEANLILKIKIDESPKELKFQYDKALFEISDYKNDEIQNKAKGNRTIPIKIKCKSVFNVKKDITILADHQVCGRLNILPNNFSYNIKVVFVPITTKISGTVQIGTINNMEKIKLKQVLSQSYVQGSVEEEGLDLSGFFTSNWFNWWYTQNGQIKTHELHKYLNDKIHSKNGKYRDYYKVYVFGSSSGGLNGIAEDVGHVKSAIVFPGRLTSDPSMGTSVHELLHAIGLQHTFDNNSKYTFERTVLDNVMDYSHWNSINRISTTHWQWKIIQSSLNSHKKVVK